MSINIHNTNILAWYTLQKYQQHQKTYAQGQTYPLICVEFRMPPFQIYRTTALGVSISSFVITNVDTGATHDITATHGMTTEQFTPTDADDYDLIVYTGLTNNSTLVSAAVPEGVYEATMTDGTNTWYSERFCMKANISSYIKISYWNLVPFRTKLGHIHYGEPYLNFVYFDSVINRPEWVEEEDIEERDGLRFPVHMISRKVRRIVGLLIPEYLCDALRLAWMHTNVVVEYDGISYITDRFRIIFDDFEKTGHLCPITIEFDTDTVNTQTGFTVDENDNGDYDQDDYNDDFLND